MAPDAGGDRVTLGPLTALVIAAGLLTVVTVNPAWWGLAPGTAARPAVRWITVAAGAALAGGGVARGDVLLGAALAAAALAAGADLACREIPHRWVAVMAAAGVLEVVAGQAALTSTVVTAAAIGLFFIAVHLMTRSGLGLGDVKLAIGMALALGWPRALSATVLGLWAGGLWALWLLISRRAARTSGIPLGPFLVLGMALSALATAPW
jgi:leader peptidase (prepilin peptidase)/N-methyltransferase